MLKITLLLLLLGFANTVRSQSVPVIPDMVTTTIAYEKAFFDFGEVVQGALVTHIFKFTNSGNAPLLITDAKVTCGCTVPTYPREPIAPGAAGEISVTFNTAEKAGRQLKVITMVANTVPGETFLQLSGEVKVRKKRKH